MADRTLQRTEVLNQHVSFIGPYCPTSLQQGRSFYMYVLVGYFILILKSALIACKEWVVASTRLESCVLGKECVILLF